MVALCKNCGHQIEFNKSVNKWFHYSTKLHKYSYVCHSCSNNICRLPQVIVTVVPMAFPVKMTTEGYGYDNCRLTVKHHRNRIGCDICKKDCPTEAYIGFCGHALWICSKCFNKIIKV
jgi:hypothetical protein